MSSVVHRVRRFFTEREKPLEKGIYHYRTPQGQDEQFRLHLRVEPGGQGMLVINAARVMHLNPTATELAKLMLEEKTEDEAAAHMSRRYRVSRAQARADYEKLRDTILTCARTDEVCPITYLDVERIEPFQTPVTAPYRMDLAITYRCNADCPHCYVGRSRDFPEMPTEKWKEVLRKLWDIGIPHVTFTGGDPTVRDDLRDLIATAEEIGQVTGVLTNGRKLADKEYLAGLVAAGLDHVQITIESHDEAIHNHMVGCQGWADTVAGIANCIAQNVYLMTNTTLTHENVPTIVETIDFIASLGVKNFACNSLIYSGKGKEVGTGFKEKELESILQRCKEAANRNGMRMVWYTPTQYCELDPVKQELGLKTCTAAMYNMAIEPNGDVIPCQSYYVSMGNILTDPWDSIWNSEVARCIRDRTWVEEKCKTCESLPLCGGGCPLYVAEHAFRCTESHSTAP
jgi:radical SAM protein with 4Fe4S-binding SPASM domain